MDSLPVTVCMSYFIRLTTSHNLILILILQFMIQFSHTSKCVASYSLPINMLQPSCNIIQFSCNIWTFTISHILDLTWHSSKLDYFNFWLTQIVRLMILKSYNWTTKIITKFDIKAMLSNSRGINIDFFPKILEYWFQIIIVLQLKSLNSRLTCFDKIFTKLLG